MARRRKQRTVWCRSCGKPRKGRRSDPCPHCEHEPSPQDAPSEIDEVPDGIDDSESEYAWNPLETGRLAAVRAQPPTPPQAPVSPQLEPPRSPLSPQTVRVECVCGKVFTTSAANAGKTGRCGSCGASFVIPLVTASPAEFSTLPPEIRAFARTAPHETSALEGTPLVAASTPPGEPTGFEVKVRFTCACGWGFETSATNVGKQGTCASCGQAFVVPDASVPNSGPLAQLAPSASECPPEQRATEEKECPHCAEFVKARAQVCRFCRYDFANAVEADALPATRRESSGSSRRGARLGAVRRGPRAARTAQSGSKKTPFVVVGVCVASFSLCCLLGVARNVEDTSAGSNELTRDLDRLAKQLDKFDRPSARGPRGRPSNTETLESMSALALARHIKLNLAPGSGVALEDAWANQYSPYYSIRNGQLSIAKIQLNHYLEIARNSKVSPEFMEAMEALSKKLP